MIEQLVQEMGKRWAEIARRLGNRSDNAVKNWWNGSMNRRKRHHPHISSARPAFPAMLSLAQQMSMPNLEQRWRPQELLSPYTHSQAQQSYFPHQPHYEQFHYRPENHRPQLSGSSLPLLETRPQPQQQMALSASPAFQSTLEVFSRQYSQEDRLSMRPVLAPLVHTTSHAEWHTGRFDGRLDSPALRSTQQAPSLVSDDQSDCSISPKTLPSPRAVLSAPGSSKLQAPRLQRYDTVSDEGYASHQSAGASEKQTSMAVDPALQRPPYPSYLETRAVMEARREGSPRSGRGTPPAQKDARMDLSSVLL